MNRAVHVNYVDLHERTLTTDRFLELSALVGRHCVGFGDERDDVDFVV